MSIPREYVLTKCFIFLNGNKEERERKRSMKIIMIIMASIDWLLWDGLCPTVNRNPYVAEVLTPQYLTM